MVPRLITIPFSHYCEQARWALDRAGVSFVEEPHLPGLHLRPMRKAGGTTVPLLVLADRTLRDSAEIMASAAADGAWREILDEMRATAAGAHVLRLYREERAWNASASAREVASARASAVATGSPSRTSSRT